MNTPEKEKVQPASNLLDLTPRLAPKWAKTYATLWKDKGPLVAKAWAKVFLRDDSRHLGLLKDAATKELQKRGLIPVDPQDPTVA